jgi:Spy/CpxP family protein refolding chaperone
VGLEPTVMPVYKTGAVAAEPRRPVSTICAQPVFPTSTAHPRLRARYAWSVDGVVERGRPLAFSDFSDMQEASSSKGDAARTGLEVAIMSLFRVLRASAVLAGGFCYATFLTACAGGNGGSQPPGQGAVPNLAQSRVAQSDATQPSWGFGGHHFGFGRVMRGINLSDQQRAQIRQLVQQYHQAHPKGSTFDPQGREQLRQQILGVLTPQQQTQLKQNMQQWRGGPMGRLNLTDQQRTQIHQLMQQYRQAHPRGSAFDPQAREQLRQQILSVLTLQQQTQLKQNMQQWRGGPMGRLNLTDQQRTQIHGLMQQYRQAHPRGTASDPQAREQLHQQILNILTPQQRAQLSQSLTTN